MNGKIAKIIRAYAAKRTIGQSAATTRTEYHKAKRAYLSADTGQHPKLDEPRKRKSSFHGWRNKPSYSTPPNRVF